MPLHPQVQTMRDSRVPGEAQPLYTMTIEEARAADLASIQSTSGGAEPVFRVTEATIPGPVEPLLIRIYMPYSSVRPLPVLVYFFGGGWTLGSLDTSDAVCRSLTNRVGCVTVAIGYRLAPENKFPAAVLDCRTGLQWVANNAVTFGADPDRLAVAGDSAGGNLAAASCILARDLGGPRIVAQVLIYPNTLYGSTTRSVYDNEDPAFFNRSSMDWYWRQYLLDPKDGADPLASPMLASDHSGLPRALVITAEYDPLRDEGEMYASKLGAAGVPVIANRYSGMIHGFFTMSGRLDAAKDALSEVAQYLRDALHSELPA